MATLEELVGLDWLNQCTKECTKQSRWKETTQRYLADMLSKNIKLQDDVLSHRYRVEPTIDFTINERGHIRKIEAPVVRDRVIQKSLMKKVLVPALRPYIIYDNYASLKDRGTSFARKRFEVLLHRYIRKHGTDGYILLIDNKKYFESIRHDVLKKMIAGRLKDEPVDVMELIHYIIDTSSHSEKGLNLGSETPQIFAVYYQNEIDTYIKVVKSVKYYGRYMDDSFVIGESKEELKNLLSEIEQRLSVIGLKLNGKKTHIVKLRHGFTFLQIKYNILESGKVLKRLSHKKIVRERRRLRAFRRKMGEGTMTVGEIWNCYKSWRGTVVKEHNACYKSIHGMDMLYGSLFPGYQKEEKKGKRALCVEIWKESESEDLRYIV